LKDQLQLILELQTADAKVKELQAQINKLPERLEPSRRDLAKLEAMVAAEKGRIDESVQWRKNQETLLEREQEGLRAARAKLNAVKNTKEYNAASREVDNRRKGILDREAELKKVSEAMATSVTDAEAHAKDVEALRATLAVEEEKVRAQVEALQAQAAEAITIRDAARVKIDKSWLKTYDSLASKKGYAVAPVVKGTCQGCHMTLPPQLNNILARLESIEMCPRCGRMIYRKELLDPTPAASGGGGDTPAG
jgi:predicted  nucleic acid-binding Zn-ribbon protein